MTNEIISRFQFAFTMSFHILFPAFSIGLAMFLVIMEGAWLKTKNPLYLTICKFWIKVFALTFGMGVVSGLVMSFQLGTNWAGFTEKVGPVLGSLFTYEVLTAFFIEAGFLGVMIFGWNKVGPRLHYAATWLVCAGVIISAFWILSANSWMQTPAGVSLVDGEFVINNWFDVIFNPSDLSRYLHMLIAAYVATAFVIASVSAYYILKQQHLAFAKKCFSFAFWAIAILAPLQILVGDEVGLNINKYQPIKTATIEGVWDTQQGAPLLIFAVPDQEQEKNLYTIKIPHLASLINTHEWNGTLVGLKSVSKADQPPVAIVFYTFRIMLGIGMLMLFLAIISLILRWRKRFYETKWFLKATLFSAPIGFIAILTGWYTAELGRQPWAVYGLLRTADATSPAVPMSHVLITFALIIIIYGIIFGIFYFRYLFKVIKAGPAKSEPPERSTFAYMSTSKELDNA